MNVHCSIIVRLHRELRILERMYSICTLYDGMVHIGQWHLHWRAGARYNWRDFSPALSPYRNVLRNSK